MATVDVLIAGHVEETEAGQSVHPSVSLVRDDDLVVRTDDGTIVLTHAWWFADMTPVHDPLHWDQDALDRSRERILGIADIVVPGHGPASRPAHRQTESSVPRGGNVG